MPKDTSFDKFLDSSSHYRLIRVPANQKRSQRYKVVVDEKESEVLHNILGGIKVAFLSVFRLFGLFKDTFSDSVYEMETGRVRQLMEIDLGVNTRQNLASLAACTVDGCLEVSRLKLLINIRKGENNWKDVPRELTVNRKFMMQAISENAEIFKDLPKALQNDESFALEALRRNPEVVLYLPEDFANNREFIRKAIKRNKNVAKFRGNEQIYKLNVAAKKIQKAFKAYQARWQPFDRYVDKHYEVYANSEGRVAKTRSIRHVREVYFGETHTVGVHRLRNARVIDRLVRSTLPKESDKKSTAALLLESEADEKGSSHLQGKYVTEDIERSGWDRKQVHIQTAINNLFKLEHVVSMLIKFKREKNAKEKLKLYRKIISQLMLIDNHRLNKFLGAEASPDKPALLDFMVSRYFAFIANQTGEAANKEHEGRQKSLIKSVASAKQKHHKVMLIAGSEHLVQKEKIEEHLLPTLSKDAAILIPKDIEASAEELKEMLHFGTRDKNIIGGVRRRSFSEAMTFITEYLRKNVKNLEQDIGLEEDLKDVMMLVGFLRSEALGNGAISDKQALLMLSPIVSKRSIGMRILLFVTKLLS